MSNTEGKDTQGENLLVEMSATMNNLARAYDQKDDRLMKYLMDKVYGLSHKGISHLMQLDKANEELASLREQLATEQDMRSTAEFANRMIIKDLNEKLKQKEDENRELKASIAVLLDELMYESTTGDFWMWARSNEKVPDRIMKIRNDNLSA